MAIKRPVSIKQAKRSPKAAARRESFCARMGGARKKLTGKAKARDPLSAINRSLAAWDCDVPALLKPKHVSKGIRPNPVPPSSRAGRNRTVRGELEQAADLYERFSGHEPEEIGRVKIPPTPRVGVAVGTVDGILYTTVRDGQSEKYIHKFRQSDKPLFVVSPDGRQLFLIGGRYAFTEMGIVDMSDTKNWKKAHR